MDISCQISVFPADNVPTSAGKRTAWFNGYLYPCDIGNFLFSRLNGHFSLELLFTENYLFVSIVFHLTVNLSGMYKLSVKKIVSFP